jgi:hypothetical protein
MSGIGAIPVKRGCGTRQAGGVYWELGIGPGGAPAEAFLVDAPQLLPEGYVLPNRGVGILERGAVTHLVDRIGLSDYPNTLDYFLEGKEYGYSRRLPATLDYSVLGEASRLLPVHDRAFLHNYADLCAANVTLPSVICPKGLPHHPLWCAIGRAEQVGWQEYGIELEPPQELRSFGTIERVGVILPTQRVNPLYVREDALAASARGEAYEHYHIEVVPPEPMCCSAWWSLLDPDTCEPAPQVHGWGDGYSKRKMPSFEYNAYKVPGDFSPKYAPAIFMSLPASRIVIVRDEDDPQYAEKAERIDRMLDGRLHFTEVDQ